MLNNLLDVALPPISAETTATPETTPAPAQAEPTATPDNSFDMFDIGGIEFTTSTAPAETPEVIVDGNSSNLTSFILLIAIYLLAAGLVITLIILFCKQRSAKKRANSRRRN